VPVRFTEQEAGRRVLSDVVEHDRRAVAGGRFGPRQFLRGFSLCFGGPVVFAT
jgi:hypothetical protein